MTFTEYLSQRWPDIVPLVVEHAQIVVAAVAIAAVVGIGLGIVVEGHAAATNVALAVSGAMLTIPSFALFGLMIPLLGLGAAPTIAALVLYAVFPILRNTVTGLASVPAEVEDAARGMGLSTTRRMVSIRLPMAWPVIITGVRVATIMSVGIAAIAAAVSGPGLGELIFNGLARIGSANSLNDTLAGVIGVALLALAIDLLFVGFARLTTSRGLRD